MFSRTATRAPRALVRYTSSSIGRTWRIVEVAPRVDRPTVLEAAVPVLWVLCGALTYTAWRRMEGRVGDEVERLLVV